MNNENEISENGFPTESSDTAQLYAEIDSDLKNSAVRHYYKCPNVNEARQSSPSSLKISNNSHTSSQIQTINNLEKWLKREQIVKSIQEMHQYK